MLRNGHFALLNPLIQGNGPLLTTPYKKKKKKKRKLAMKLSSMGVSTDTGVCTEHYGTITCTYGDWNV